MGETSRCVENLRSRRCHGVLSRGQSSQSQFKPAATAWRESAVAVSVQQAREVTQQPVASPCVEGQEPSGSCALRTN